MPFIAPWVATAVQGLLEIYGGASFAVASAAYYVTYAAVTMAVLYGAQKLLSPNLKGNNITDHQRLIKNSIAPRDLVYGRVQKSGVLAHIQQSGSKNEHLYMAVMLAANEIDSIEQFNLNNYQLSVATAPPVATVTNETNLNTGVLGEVGFAGKVELYLKDDTGTYHFGRWNQTVDLGYQTAVGIGRWPNTSIFGEIAWVGFHFIFDKNVFGGGIPNPTFLVHGRKLVDPRTSYTPTGTITAGTNSLVVSSAAGLAPGMRVIGPGMKSQCKINSIAGTTLTLSRNATIDVSSRMYLIGNDAYSNNAALVIMDYMLDQRYGLKSQPEDFNMNALIASLNNCDESILLNDGSHEPRYTCNTVIDTTQTPGAIIQNLLTSMAGELVWASGQWFLYSGVWRAPTVTISENDFRDTPSIPTMPSRRDLINSCKGMFVCPQQFWQGTDFPPYQNATYIAQDQGEVLWIDLQLPCTTSAATAQRLAKIQVLRARAGIVTLSVNCKLTVMGIQAGDNIYLNYARMGWVNQLFEVVGFVFASFNDEEGKPALGINLTLRSTNASVYDFAAGTDTPLPAGPASLLPNPFRVALPTAMTVVSNASTLQFTPDGIVVPALKVSWTAPAETQVQNGGKVQVQYRIHGAGSWTDWKDILGDTTSDLITDVVSGTVYDVRIRGVTGQGITSDWVEVDSTTAAGTAVAPSVPTSVVATSGAGLNALVWDLSTDSSIKYYKIWRSTAADGSGASFLQQAWSNQFKDTSAVVGTTYYYLVSAVNNSNVESAKSAVSNGATAVRGGPNTTAPSAPSAATLSTQGAYMATDGSIYAYMTFSIPAMPTGAAWQELEFQLNGGSNWIMFAYLVNTGSLSVTIPDLTPGQVYGVRTVAYNSDGVPSTPTAATSSPFTAPSKTSAPSAPASGAFTGGGVKPAYFPGSTSFDFGTHVTWAKVTDLDLAYYEVKATFTDADGATDYSWTPQNAPSLPTPTSETWMDLYNHSLVAGYIRIRSSDNSGNKSAWVRLGNANAAASIGTGDMATQSKTASNITGVKLNSGGGSPVSLVALAPFNAVVLLAGGSPTELVSVSLSGYGLTAAPVTAQVAVVDPPTGIFAAYDFSNGSNTSTLMYIKVTALSGNLPNSLIRLNIWAHQ